MIRPWPFLIIFTLSLSVFGRHFLDYHLYWMTPIEVFGIIPLLDLLLGQYPRNPTPEEEAVLQERKSFRYITYACAAMQWVSVIGGAWAFSRPDAGLFTRATIILAVGIVSGVMGINVAHELIHRVNGRFEPFLGRAMLLSVLYLHWSIEHVVGHHRRVATAEDPATAPLGQSYYRFWPRTVFGGILSAWTIERDRLRHRRLPLYSRHNRLLRYLALQAGLLVCMAAVFGTPGLVFLVGQALVGVSLLESVNYLEHYGLLRRKLPDGGYEPFSERHSWNQASRLTNWYLFNLQRHADHHVRVGRRYQALHHIEGSPQLPAGYATLVPLTLVPPLWFRVMDPRVPDRDALAEGGDVKPAESA